MSKSQESQFNYTKPARNCGHIRLSTTLQHDLDSDELASMGAMRSLLAVHILVVQECDEERAADGVA